MSSASLPSPTVLGFPRIGARRELKFALEKFWRGEIAAEALEQQGAEIRATQRQAYAAAGIDRIPCGDFSFYDHIADLSITLGHLPRRFRGLAENGASELDLLFALGRGAKTIKGDAAACSLRKWFDTNYHYLVPEFAAGDLFRPQVERVLAPWREAKAAGFEARPVLVGPLTFLQLGMEAVDAAPGFDRFWLLPELVYAYRQILTALGEAGVEWVQLDEPILALDLPPERLGQFQSVYGQFAALAQRPKVLLTSYFDRYSANLDLVLALPVDGLHLDAARAGDELETVLRAFEAAADQRVLSLGLVNGRNIWRHELAAGQEMLRGVTQRLGADRLWVSSSCSLLHVPWSLAGECVADGLDGQMAGAVEKLEELRRLASLAGGEGDPQWLIEDERLRAERAAALASAAPTGEVGELSDRRVPFAQRAEAQKVLDLPLLPTTTIGSFPQTAEVRGLRARWRKGELDDAGYQVALEDATRECLRRQEELGLDVLVHGEFERNDMVEYFGEQLDGFAFTKNGWVQSYGSRCVKPPVLHGPVSRPQAMTVEWARFAQSCTDKLVKGMLTGPVTILKWSFVREDQPLTVTMAEIALSIRQEVCDLEEAGIRIIQIDEAALREALPLRREAQGAWLEEATRCFRLATSGVQPETQIHTHMCYSDFAQIASAIVELDADVITIEAARSEMAVLEGFREIGYPNAMGPGLYDIHSPLVPTVEELLRRLRRAARTIPPERLWANPDCGLKTRGWPETEAALRHLVEATRLFRAELARDAEAEVLVAGE